MSEINVVAVLEFVCYFFVHSNKADNEEHKQDEDKDRQVRDAIIARSNVPAEGMWPPNIRDGTAAFSHMRIGITWISHA